MKEQDDVTANVLQEFDAYCEHIDQKIQSLPPEDVKYLLKVFIKSNHKDLMYLDHKGGYLNALLLDKKDMNSAGDIAYQKAILRTIFKCVKAHPLVRESIRVSSVEERTFLYDLSDPGVLVGWALEGFNVSCGQVGEAVSKGLGVGALIDEENVDKVVAVAHLRRCSYIAQVLLNVYTKSDIAGQSMKVFNEYLGSSVASMQIGSYKMGDLVGVKLKEDTSVGAGSKKETRIEREPYGEKAPQKEGESAFKKLISASAIGLQEKASDPHVPFKVGPLVRFNQSHSTLRALFVGASVSIGASVLPAIFSSIRGFESTALAGVGVLCMLSSALISRSTNMHLLWQKKIKASILKAYPWMRNIPKENIKAWLSLGERLNGVQAKNVFTQLFGFDEQDWIDDNRVKTERQQWAKNGVVRLAEGLVVGDASSNEHYTKVYKLLVDTYKKNHLDVVMKDKSEYQKVCELLWSRPFFLFATQVWEQSIFNDDIQNIKVLKEYESEFLSRSGESALGEYDGVKRVQYGQNNVTDESLQKLQNEYVNAASKVYIKSMLGSLDDYFVLGYESLVQKQALEQAVLKEQKGIPKVSVLRL